MAEIKFEIKKHLGVLSNKGPDAWNTELNVVSWNEGAPKFDIRSWDPEHEKCGKGITLSGDEMKELRKILNGDDDSKFYNEDGTIIF